jgi:hypothetical protein
MKGLSTEAENLEQMKHSVKKLVPNVSFEIISEIGSDCNE